VSQPGSTCPSAIEQLLDPDTLRARHRQHGARAVEAGDGGATVACLAEMSDQIRPRAAGAVRAPEDSRGLEERTSRLDEGGALVDIELAGQRHELERGEVCTRQLGHADLVDHRPEHLAKARRCLRAALRWCRAQAQAMRRDARLERLDAEARAEMVRFVDDEEPESIAELVHAPVRALERHDRDRLDLRLAVAEHADGEVRPRRELATPLFDQRARGREDRGGTRCVGHRRDRDACLARPGRERDQAPTPEGAPGGHGVGLVAPQRRNADLDAAIASRRRRSAECDAAISPGSHELVETVSRSAMAGRSIVPRHTSDIGDERRGAAEADRSAVEGEVERGHRPRTFARGVPVGERPFRARSPTLSLADGNADLAGATAAASRRVW
jgi:hypothetical protein